MFTKACHLKRYFHTFLTDALMYLKYRPECDHVMSEGTTNLGHLCPDVMRKWTGHEEQRQGDWERGSHHVNFMQVSGGETKKAHEHEAPVNYKGQPDKRKVKCSSYWGQTVVINWQKQRKKKRFIIADVPKYKMMQMITNEGQIIQEQKLYMNKGKMQSKE